MFVLTGGGEGLENLYYRESDKSIITYSPDVKVRRGRSSVSEEVSPEHGSSKLSNFDYLNRYCIYL